MRNFEEAILDFDNLLKYDSTNPSAQFIRGKCLNETQKENEALLAFEDVFKHSGDSSLTCSALFEIAMLRIKQRDFYEAHHTLRRHIKVDIISPNLDLMRKFVESSIFLMKRKTKKALITLS
jgi:TolA-binding protein